MKQGDELMSSLSDEQLLKLREKEYALRTVVNRLRREVYQQSDLAVSSTLLEELGKVEDELHGTEEQLAKIQPKSPGGGLILDTTQQKVTAARRGGDTTGLEVKVHLNMKQLPTAICHLLDRDKHPLITCEVKAVKATAGQSPKRRVRVTSYIEGYSAKVIDTFEVPVGQVHTFKQLPTLFADRIRPVTELTRATLNVMVEDLDGKVELHETEWIWLLARTSAPLFVQDPQTSQWQDLTYYLGAFVTPNAPSLMNFLREAARQHPSGRLVGYQGNPNEVTLQVKALFEVLKTAEITYVNSVIDFNPDQGTSSQRVRLPRESLADKQANCIDGTVLFASLLEGISMNPAIMLVPGHAFLGWETWSGSKEWHYLETTMIGTSTFDEACASAEKTAAAYQSKQQLTKLSLADLRSRYQITPME